MVDKWNVFNKTDFVGVLSYDEEKKFFSFDYKGKTERALFTYKFILNADKDQNWFKESLFDRVMPENRVNCREILRKIGMLKYDPWELLKHTQMVFTDDLVWMTKNKDLNEFFDIHPLAGIKN